MRESDLEKFYRRVEKERGENAPRDKRFLEDIAIKAVYTSADLPKNYESLPGFFPYTRGVRASMYTERPWTIRQYAGFSSAKASNQFYRDCLRGGQKGLSVAFDLPTHRGYDSDDPFVADDVGKAGVAIDSVMDMKTLFDGIDLSSVSVSMTMNGAVLPVLAAFIVNAEEHGVPHSLLAGTIQNDILKEFMVRNTFIYPPQPSMRIVADIIEYCSRHMPKFNSISISGYHIHEAGADLALELGLTLADGVAYVQCALDRGLSLDQFAPRLSFFFATGMNFFMEIAKLRAARKLWAEIMREFGCTDEKSLQLRTHCQTSGWSLTAKDPYNNIIRTTIEAMASVLGGTQSLHTNSFDEAIALPTKKSARIARNTQLILQHETKICDVVDPLGGSYYVEYLTDELANKARGYIEKIKAAGGMALAIQEGMPMRMIEAAAQRRQALIDSAQEVVVGVNKFSLDEEEPIEILTIDNLSVIEEQKKNLESLRRTRDQEHVTRALDALREGALHSANLLELAILAMKARATVGEVTRALEDVFGRFKPEVFTSSGVYKTVYGENDNIKKLLDEVREFAKKTGRQPRILVAKMGQDGHDRGAKVIASAFADFGFDVDLSPLFETPASIARQAVDNDVHVIGVSTLAGAHTTLVPKLLDELKKLHTSGIIVVVGGVVPVQEHEFLKRAGAAFIFGPGTNTVDAAREIIQLLRKDW